MRRIHSLQLSLFLSVSLTPLAALAVTVVPSPAQPSRVQEQLNLEETRPTVGGEAIITLPDENGTNKALKADVTFKLNDIVIEGSTVFTKEELLPVYASYLGKDASLATLNTIASKITAHYRNAGYILSRAVVPPQHIDKGIVKIKIIEGYVSKVIIQGPAEKSSLVNEYADKIRAEKPLNSATLERYLLLIQDLPGVTAHAVLQPSPTEVGASQVIITMSDKMVDGSVSADNRGTRYLGPVEGGLTAAANNVLGLYDRTQFRTEETANPHELEFFQIQHEEQLDSEGTKLTLSAGHTHTNPGYRLSTLDIDGIDNAYSVEISHPFVRSRQTNWYGNMEFDIRNTSSESLGDSLYTDNLHVLRVGSSYDFVDSLSAVNRLNGQVSKGFGWDDDSAPFIRSRIDGHTNFYKATADANRLQPISGPFGLYVATTGQMASGEMLSAEQFGIGGANFGSAYDPSEITGDSGLAGRVELQYSRSGDSEYIPTYQLYGFYDIGEVWTRNPAAGSNATDSLADAGAGIRFNIMAPVSGDLEVAVPLTRPVAANNPSDGNGTRVFFSLAYRY